jgi:hypothetical protein
MSVTCSSNTALTDNELDAIFGNGTTLGLLPSTPNSSSERDSNGILLESSVKNIVDRLKSSGILPSSTTNSNTVIEKQKNVIKNIQDEYCFYYARYKYSLQRLLNTIQQGYINNTAENQIIVQKYLKHTQTLNIKLNDLLQITNGVTEDMLNSNTTLENEIKGFEAKFKENQKKLMEQNRIISSHNAVTNLNKEMVKFTEEKARYTDNLLKMYSVLNIVAVGLLIYVYKSSAQ